SSSADRPAAVPSDRRTWSMTTLLPGVAEMRGHSTSAAAAIPGSCSDSTRAKPARASSLAGLNPRRRRVQAPHSASLLLEQPVHDDIAHLRHAVLVDRGPVSGHAPVE